MQIVRMYTTDGRCGCIDSRHVAAVLTVTALAAALSCTATPARDSGPTFATPEEAVRTLVDAVKAGKLDEVVGIFGPDGRELIATSDPGTAHRNLEVFAAATAERWQLLDRGSDSKTLVIGNEGWPFPVPLVKAASGWRFDTGAGKEEVLARRIGRNELAVMAICRVYVAAQRLYATRPHDGQPAGAYARVLRSDPGQENGLYWPVKEGGRRSPLGDLVAHAAAEGKRDQPGQPAPFHGYYFRILTGQGPAGTGGAQDYVKNGAMSGGFALVAWPAEYDVTGVMTFIVNQDDVVYQKDLGPGTDTVAKTMAVYEPDSTWQKAR
jgi:Protein of unknown function (DUF2950)